MVDSIAELKKKPDYRKTRF